MSILETVLVYGVAPAALFLLIALLAARKGLSRRSRYRPGEPWNHPPIWWSANPEGSGLPEAPSSPALFGHDSADDRAYDGEGGDRTSVPLSAANRGGAHGDW